MIRLIPVTCVILLIGLLTIAMFGAGVPLPNWIPSAAMLFIISGVLGLLLLLAIVPWLDERERKREADPHRQALVKAYEAVLKEHEKDGKQICGCESCDRGRRIAGKPNWPEKK